MFGVIYVTISISLPDETIECIYNLIELTNYHNLYQCNHVNNKHGGLTCLRFVNGDYFDNYYSALITEHTFSDLNEHVCHNTAGYNFKVAQRNSTCNCFNFIILYCTWLYYNKFVQYNT